MRRGNWITWIHRAVRSAWRYLLRGTPTERRASRAWIRRSWKHRLQEEPAEGRVRRSADRVTFDGRLSQGAGFRLHAAAPVVGGDEPHPEVARLLEASEQRLKKGVTIQALSRPVELGAVITATIVSNGNAKTEQLLVVYPVDPGGRTEH